MALLFNRNWYQLLVLIQKGGRISKKIKENI